MGGEIVFSLPKLGKFTQFEEPFKFERGGWEENFTSCCPFANTDITDIMGLKE